VLSVFAARHHRILETFEPLYNCFVNQPKCHTMVPKFFVKESSKFRLHFHQNQLKYLIKVFNEWSAKIQLLKLQRISVIENKACNRKPSKFIPTKAREEPNKVKDDSSKGVQYLVLKFYNLLWDVSLVGRIF
jgi:hypothetical protein